MELRELESAIEGILFAAGDPVSVERICLSLSLDRITVEQLLSKLMDYYAYERRGMRIVRMDNQYQMCSAPEHAELIRQTFERRRPARLSQPALEVLAIIAYFQPVTRAYVEQLRGVDSSYTVGLLQERGLIEEAGRLSVPGRPMQFRTTDLFLRSFSLSSLEELPELPSNSPEDGQITIEMQEKLRELAEEQARVEAEKHAEAEAHRQAVEQAMAQRSGQDSDKQDESETSAQAEAEPTEG